MIRSVIITNARKKVNDTDSSTPFHTDNECHAILDNWELNVRLVIGNPKTRQTLTFAQGDGGGGTPKELNSDFLAITKAILIPSPASALQHTPLTILSEDDMDEASPSWRDDTSQGQAKRLVIIGDVTADASAYSNFQVTLDRVCDKAYSVLVRGIQLPTASTDGTKSPQIPGQYHHTAEYFLAAVMLEPRNPAKSEAMMRMYEKKLREAQTLGGLIQSPDVDIWGDVPDLG